MLYTYTVSEVRDAPVVVCKRGTSDARGVACKRDLTHLVKRSSVTRDARGAACKRGMTYLVQHASLTRGALGSA